MKQNTTKFTPFQLTYGRKAITPLDLLLASNEEAIEDNKFEENLLQRTCTIIKQLEPERKLARKNIEKSQEKQKERQQLSPAVQKFEVGDLVLKYKWVKEKESKFVAKWLGPYRIYQVIGNGAYKLRTMEGKVLAKTTHGNDLKKYQIRELPIPEIIIE